MGLIGRRAAGDRGAVLPQIETSALGGSKHLSLEPHHRGLARQFHLAEVAAEPADAFADPVEAAPAAEVEDAAVETAEAIGDGEEDILDLPPEA